VEPVLDGTDGATGLVELDLAGPTGAGPESVAAYLLRSKGWKPDAYRLENRAAARRWTLHVIRVVDPRDEAGAQPGGGSSSNSPSTARPGGSSGNSAPVGGPAPWLATRRTE